MIIEIVDAGIHGVNTYVVGDDVTKKATIIDPTGNFEKIKSIIDKNNLEPECALLTHGHGDHIGAVMAIKKHYDIPVMAHIMEKETICNAEINLSTVLGMGSIEFEADQYLHQDDLITVGNLTIKVLHTPGHTKGSVCFLVENALFSGDTLFAGSMGRTDLHGGNEREMIESLRTLKYLKKDYNVFPGHGPATTLNKEKSTNPFLRNV